MTRLVCGDCLEVMKTLPDESVDCVVTSPPYYGLRDYDVAGQLGLEPTPEAYVARLVAVFAEVKRVLRDDGTVWLNLGDSYTNTGEVGRNDGAGPGRLLGRTQKARRDRKTKSIHGLKPKDLIGIPWRVAFALQADGWYLRSDIIWHKPNPMPESVRDRPTKAHEYLFLLAKQERYWYDADAIREPHAELRMFRGKDAKTIYRGAISGGADNRYAPGPCGYGQPDGGRNRRTVWTITPKPFKGAHFAVMPEALVEPCILAGCRPGGTVLDPFVGAGTVPAVAQRLGRNAIGIDLNAAYLKLASKRIRTAESALPLFPCHGG